MSEFRPHPLFYDALSGRFQPPFDPSHFHTLGRLANGTAIKGEGPDDFRFYIPPWADETSATLTTGHGEYEHVLTLNEMYRTIDPRILAVGHKATNATMGPRRDYVVIRTNEVSEEAVPLPRGGEPLDQLQLRVAELAQQFYRRTATNVEEGAVSELYVPNHIIGTAPSERQS